ncbi:MAG: hypothetical protein LBR56_07500, partial [Sporomusaceae bacterium]|nr:hypothetical protein [Sporomusaceae bacterium]
GLKVPPLFFFLSLVWGWWGCRNWGKNFFVKKFFPQTPFSKNFSSWEGKKNLEVSCCNTR